MILKKIDQDVHYWIQKESQRQNTGIELIASENYVSEAVMECQGSVMTNKYAEGYSGRRYYGGCKYVDQVEEIAISRLKKLFKAKYANVQPHSGSQANQAVYLALLKPGDKILGMSLDCGGHLSHGAKVNLTGKWFQTLYYGVKQDSLLIDYDQVRDIAKKDRPKLIIAGFSAYTRPIDFKKFREIANEVDAYLLADIAHISGIVAAEYHSNPLEHADIVTSTTHKTLRGPRGGIIMSNDLDIGKKIDFAVFPGLQGGPLMHIIAAKAVAFKEALSKDYKKYMYRVLQNAKCLSSTLMQRNIDILTGGTDNHMVMVDLRNRNITGKDAEKALGSYHITCNKNTVPFDTRSPFVTSGLRFGTPALTTRGFNEKAFTAVGNIIADIIDEFKPDHNFSNNFSLKINDNIKHIYKNLLI